MDRAEAIYRLRVMVVEADTKADIQALDLAIEALGQTEIVRCKDCKHYNPPHIEYNDGTRKDYPDELVTVDIGMNVGGKCENSTTTMRTYCTAHDRENPDDFEELVIFRQPMEYCSFGEKAEKHQLSGETSTISEMESVEGVAESATTTDCISRQQAVEEIGRWLGYLDEDMIARIRIGIRNLPPVTPTERTGEWISIPYEIYGQGEVVEDGYVWQCTNCGDAKKRNNPDMNFCPNCGARMDGDDNE